VAERTGFDSIWVMDHLVPEHPLGYEGKLNSFEGWTFATALAARTTLIRIAHAVLCDGFRHPSLLARMASTLDVISGGRFELGIGWGSHVTAEELRRYGFGTPSNRDRAERLRETLDIFRLMLACKPFDYDGRYFQLQDALGAPEPIQARIPVHIGGAGRQLTMPLVRKHADWWSCPPNVTADALAELRELARPARVAAMRPVALVPPGGSRAEVMERAGVRFGGTSGSSRIRSLVLGDATELAERFAAEVREGVRGFVLSFDDGASTASLERFMADVAPAVRTAATRA
jgi:alkanesulfonate monooxygenase SsuD/methylene tetrahydromethanopterin reductase-like flavin-dependent oxidoreductase (luciferase family)